MSERIWRLDFVGDTGQAEFLGDGSVRIPARIARTGVQVYKYADGRMDREYRPPDVVFADDSLATWPGVTVTEGHPATPVDTASWKAVSKGHVSDRVVQDGQFLKTDLIIKDADTIRKIAAGELVEVSAGYFVQVDRAPGTTPEGEPYDTIQRVVRGNHVALGPKGWGRAGPDVALFANDDAGSLRTGVHYPGVTDGGTDQMTITQADLDKVTGERDAAIARATAAETRAASAEAAVTQAKDAATVAQDSKTVERAIMRAEAIRMDGSKDQAIAKLARDPKTADRDVMLAVIKTADATFNADGKSDDYVRAFFDATVKASPSKADPAKTAEADKIAALAGGARTDSKDPPGGKIAAARAKMRNDNKDAWKTTPGGKDD